MKLIKLLIVILCVSATVVLALPRHLLITVHMDTWANSQKQRKVIKEVEKYVEGTNVMGFANFMQDQATGDLYGWTLHWSDQWTKKTEKLTDAKVAEINTELAVGGVTMIPCEDWRQALLDEGLIPISPGVTNAAMVAK